MSPRKKSAPIYRLACLVILVSLALPAHSADDAGSNQWLPASAQKLPRWRGFNLLNKFILGGDRPFEEKDFRIVHDLGFNFVRLPMDYREWIVNGDWTKFKESELQQIDQAVAWGEKYHVHVCLNFHRAPGYTVATPAEPTSVWTDAETQRVCALHWATFARRYKGIPSERLSFDLFNEPGRIDPQVYAKVVGTMVAAIRHEDPNRLIIADGLSWGNVPCPELVPLHIAQATRGYAPMQVSHYQASWIGGADRYPVPTWPLVSTAASGYFYGPWKSEWHTPLVLRGTFPAGTRIDLVVGTVSTRGHLIVRADDQTLFDKIYTSGAVAKEGEKVVVANGVYQDVFDQPQSVTLARAASKITISNDDGDWLTLNLLTVRPSATGPAYPVALSADWGEKEFALNFDPGDAAQHFWQRADGHGPAPIDRTWLWQNQIAPWKQLESQGVGVIVGEWGCYQKTPYDVTLHWMEDSLANFQQANWGWAMWNLYGSFGILDSDRPGAVYEDYEGHKLDRKMLELLQRY
jgi:aryl-phospho-beta-D-glucosidase BglC (GH1 family)